MPQGVKAAVQGTTVQVEGPKGKLVYNLGAGVSASTQEGKILLTANPADKQAKANWGTARAVINNMMTGVTKGWKRSLELNGVGFGAKVQGQKLVLSCGYSHDVTLDLPKELKATVNKNVVDLESFDRQLVGQWAARIRKVQPPEPYLGKGIKYVEETIRRKAGKTGKK
jgi:large subunit ribosomal protein L6